MIDGKLLAALVVSTFLSIHEARSQVYIAGTYFEATLAINCPSNGSCNLVFGGIPSGKFFMARRLNCILPLRTDFLDTPGAITLGVTTSVTGQPTRLLTPDYRLAAQGGAYVIDQDLYYKVQAGRFIRFSISNGAATGIRCTISGDLSTT